MTPPAGPRRAYRGCLAKGHLVAFCKKSKGKITVVKSSGDSGLKKETGQAAATEGDASLLASSEEGIFFKVSKTSDWKEGIGHHTWDRRRRAWLPSKVAPHPEASVRVSVDKDSYSMRGLPAPSHTQTRKMFALADTGAQMVVMGRRQAEMLGIRERDYLPAKMKIQVANNRTATTLGLAILEISVVGSSKTTWQQAYIIEGADRLYLSHEALKELDCLPEDFPGGAGQEGTVLKAGEQERPCSCPDRELPPEPPTELPVEPREENIGRLKEWIVSRYRASAFNTCTHQKLPLVKSSPPLRLYLACGVPQARQYPSPPAGRCEGRAGERCEAGGAEEGGPKHPGEVLPAQDGDCHQEEWQGEEDGGPEASQQGLSSPNPCSGASLLAGQWGASEYLEDLPGR